MKEQILKKTKFIMSIQDELCWLEQMALKGWFLTNITMGIRYTFKKDTPRKVVYDVDRFDIPKKPTLEDINSKDIFMEMASDLGWTEVTHDETMTYYFVKDYEENGINEIHTEDETRKLRAEKYCRLINEQKDSLLWPLFLVSFMDLIVMLIGLVINDRFITLYNYLCAGYITFFSLYYIYMKSLAEKVRIELSMSREQWEDNRYNIKREKKFILTNRGLTGYLAEMAKGGWLLASVTPFTYSFKKSDIADITYTIDTPSYMITRHSDMNINDKKDWYGINNDWQIQSVRDAEQNGWSYVCSLQNKTIIYSGDKNSVTPLNDNKYETV